MPFSIRDATAEDEHQVIALWRACGLVAPHNDPTADFLFAVAGPASTVLVAFVDEQIVASAMVGHDGHRGWLYYVACALERRGEGLGSSIVSAGEAWLRGRGVVKVQLMVRPANAAVLPFYEKLGYEDMPRVLMSKWLNT
ncbi:GNAT family acetyltransferase [Sphingomonas yunnanensis]|uniref:GNAT family acetyltransferase n=1 Tax=Sphingomonas yunnanensis TaxID=310400 RepID=UPI001CA6125C|nr:GNAT family acetyltransferase [Sphingomonas yunnanensis]MBY9063972.1 GNAT family acetyltransferase [Sphingomonas yunnanensis]